MSTDWLEIRNSFRGDGSPSVTIRIPDSLFAAGMLDIRVQPRIVIRITCSELESVFDPVLEKIQALVQGQIESVVAKEGKAPKASPRPSYFPEAMLTFISSTLSWSEDSAATNTCMRISRPGSMALNCCSHKGKSREDLLATILHIVNVLTHSL